jgi:hypothetical protein
MSTIQSLNSSSATYAAALTANAQAAQSAANSQAAQGTQANGTQNQDDNTWTKKHGDGSVIASLKASLAAQGFSEANSGLSKQDYMQAMHTFTHAAFAAAHAQKQSDHAGNQGNTTDTAEAFSELASQAANGNIPADLQSAFDALQQTQAAGSNGATATLAQVLQGMSQSQSQNENMLNNGAGSLIDISA